MEQRFQMDLNGMLALARATACPRRKAFALAPYRDSATDIANYIKSLPPIVHQIVDMCMFPPT
jgi:hypothetical protein